MTSSYQYYSKIRSESGMMEENRYRVLSLPGCQHKLGASEDGFPKFFVVTSDHNVMQNLNAELLSVEYNMLCNIIEGDLIYDNERFTIITLRSENEKFQKMFIDVFLMMLDTLPKNPSNIDLASKIESLLSIFSKLKRKPVHKLQGLWAELLVIEQSIDSTNVARAWHSMPNSKYDFTMGGDKIEVKSTKGENRIHHFSLDQLNPSPNSRLLICSVIVRESAKDDNGLSVFDLYDRINLKIKDSEVRMHISEILIETLGSDFYSAQKKYFDHKEACDRMAFFECKDIPKIKRDSIPALVTEVKFSVDLSYLRDIREKGFDRSNSVLFNSIY